MGRYTSNDNKSMQCNPNNGRYWSSRGYDDEDCSYNYEGSYFGLGSRLSNEQKELGYKYWKELVDCISINLSGKKLIFMEKVLGHPNHLRHPAGDDISFLFKNVLKEKASYKDLTVKFKSFKDFIENNLNFDLLRSQQEELESNIKSLKDRMSYKHFRDKTTESKISWLNKIERNNSFKFLKRILEEKNFISDDVKRNYIYFNNVYVSNSYIIFQIDPKSQGRVTGGMWDNNWSWMFACHSFDLKSAKPKVVHENFEDFFTCNLD